MVNKKSNIIGQAKKRDWGVAIPYVAGLGLIITIQLIVVYYMANFVPDAHPSFCNINSTVDCDAVARTNFALLFGVPNAIWGFLFYAFVLVLYFAKKLCNFKLFKFLEVFKHPKSYICLMTLLIFCADVILGYISTRVIHKICLLCFITYFLNFILLIVSKPKKSFVDMVVTSIDDFMKAISNKAYAVAFFLVVIFGISALIYFDNSKIFFPPEESAFSNDFSKFEPTETSNTLGAKPEEAKVVINEFTDIQCPFCAMSNLLMNKIVSEYDNVTVIHHDFPLDKACNPLLKNQMHENSCLYSQYALAAKKQDKAWGLINAMFKNNTALSEDKVLELADEIPLLNSRQLKDDAHSKEIKQELDEEIKAALDMKITATPTYIINGKKYDKGIFKYLELKKIIEENGGTRKNK